jgi:hypothetical protein
MDLFNRKEDKLLEEILDVLDDIKSLLSKAFPPRNNVSSFRVLNSKGQTSMNINQGQTTTLTAVPLAAPIPPATVGLPTTLPAGDVPQWSTSDATQATVTPSADGLSLVVAVNANATPGTTVTYTITDGVIPTATGSFQLTIQPAVTPPAPVASFSVSASTPV